MAVAGGKTEYGTSRVGICGVADHCTMNQHIP